MRSAAMLLSLALCNQLAFSRQHFSDVTTPLPIPNGSTLVIGFLGGFEHWNDPRRVYTKQPFACASCRVCSLTIENYRRSLATDLIHKAFDTNRDGHLDAAEKAQARIVLYGQAVVRLARALDREGIPVLLTVQVDTIGLNDTTFRQMCKMPSTCISATSCPCAVVPQFMPPIRREPPSLATSSITIRQVSRSRRMRAFSRQWSSAPTRKWSSTPPSGSAWNK